MDTRAQLPVYVILVAALNMHALHLGVDGVVRSKATVGLDSNMYLLNKVARSRISYSSVAGVFGATSNTSVLNFGFGGGDTDSLSRALASSLYLLNLGARSKVACST